MKYYLHDTSSFDDEKVSELFINYGYEGLGLFYTILEKLAKQEKPIKTTVLKHQLKVGKKLEKCWNFMESLGIISSNNGETFNKQLLNFSEKYAIKKEKTREKVSEWRKNQANTENVTSYVPNCNAPKVKVSKVKVSKVNIEKEIKEKNESQNKNILLSAVDKDLIPESEKQFYDIAISFQEMLIEKFTSQKLSCRNIENAKYVNWINDIRLMLETDNRSVDDIRQIWNFLKKETIGEDNFAWFLNIQSMSKLRVQFEKVLNKAKISQNGTITRKQQATNSGIQDEIRRATEQMLGVGKRTN